MSVQFLVRRNILNDGCMKKIYKKNGHEESIYPEKVVGVTEQREKGLDVLIFFFQLLHLSEKTCATMSDPTGC